MYKYISVLFLMVCGNAFCHEHHNPAPPPHVNPPHVEQHHEAQRHAENRAVERHEERSIRREERHEERHEHRLAERWNHHGVWDRACRGGNWGEGSWELHNGCRHWSCRHIVWAGNFSCYVGVFDFDGEVCVFPNVVFDFGIELPEVVVIDGVNGHYEVKSDDVVVIEAKTKWTEVDGVWKSIIVTPAVVEKRECRVWVQNDE